MGQKILKDLIEQYVQRRINFEGLDINSIASLQAHLMGGSWSCPHIGYIHFLKSIGIQMPTAGDFNSHRVGRYWEFLIQHHGAIRAAEAMKVLRSFWLWCEINKYVKGEMPADCRISEVDVIYPFTISNSFTQNKNRPERF